VVTENRNEAKYIRSPSDLAPIIMLAKLAGPVPDFKENPDAGRNHEAPIDYVDYFGERYGVYDWTYSELYQAYTPRLNRKYKDGTNYVERGIFPQGIDQIPAMVNEGERILKTTQNQEIGGKELSNERVVDLVKLGKSVEAKFPNIANLMMDIKTLPTLDFKGGTVVNNNNQELLNAIKDVGDIIKNKNDGKVSINIDKHNVDITEYTEQSRINYRNAIYSRNN